MNKDLGYYLERMGYMPNYKFPEQIDEDDEFKYYKFRVPRHYIRAHIEEGNIWPGYVENVELGSGMKDESVVLGVGFFPVHMGVDFIGEDADFLYYKVKVAKVFLETKIKGTPYTYEVLYETQDFRLKTPEELAEMDSVVESIKAGESMPDKTELEAVRKVKETETLLYEVVLYCGSCETTHDPEIAADLWDLLYARKCSFCGNTMLELRSCQSVLEESKDGEEET